MLVLSGATLVLPDRLIAAGTLVVEAGRIAEVRSDAAHREDVTALPLHGHLIVPGFIDVHMHGLEGVDTLEGNGAVGRMAALLPRHGVTAFSPTSVACSPAVLRTFLAEVRQARAEPRSTSARVLPAHLESNFINPDYAGAQPAACLRQPQPALDRLRQHYAAGQPPTAQELAAESPAFEGDAILREIAAAAADVGTVTIAAELAGGLDLIQWLVAGGHRVSLGHSAATYDEAMAAVAAGACQATHLFNCMPPLHHRSPGLAGAVLQSSELAAEVIGDGVHVHPAMIRMAVAAKGVSRVLAISDSTAVAGLPLGTGGRLGDHRVFVGARAAVLDDGRLAGSTITMAGVFRTLVDGVGLSLVEAAALCATTPARELGLTGHGVLAAGAVADLTVLGPDLTVVQTYVGGRLAWPL